MKKEDTQIDTLTRLLMEGTAEKPSAHLMNQIMEQVMKERQAKRKAYHLSRPVIPWMVGGLFAYFLLAAGLGYLLLGQSELAANATLLLTELFPLIAATIGGASLFFFCMQLDQWLRWKKGH